MKPEETIDFHVRWTWAQLSKVYNTMAAKHGGTMSMAYTLLSIDPEGTLSTKLGPKMGMQPTGLTRILKSLEDDGYIVRKFDKIDKRKVWIHLNAKGKKYRDVTKEYVIQLNEHMQSVISKSEMKTFFKVISKINRELEKTSIFDGK